MTLEERMIHLEKEVAGLQRKYNEMCHCMMRSMPASALRGILRQEEDAERWFGYLCDLADSYLVILTVKDTPGSNMPNNILEKIHCAGFDQFKTDVWRTYVGVVRQGKTVFQQFHEKEVRTDYTYESLDRSFSVKATSQAWRQGNRGDIYIDGKNCAVNLRGVNIVIYDVPGRQVIDSIGFDSHQGLRFMHLA